MVQRISKLLAQRGVCSRREAERYIEEGKVFVDGVCITEQGVKVDEDARIEVKGLESGITVMLNKPLGIVSNLPEKGYVEAKELITKENSVDGAEVDGDLHVVGRLDVNSKGLLLLTQDGRVAKKVIGPESEIEKEYIVRYEGDVSDAELRRLRFGLSLDGKRLKRACVERKESGCLRFVLKEGKKRQLRRMMELVDKKVVSLKRVRIGNLQLGDLPQGMWRFVKLEDI